MAKLVYSREEILSDHAYARPQIEAGYRLHGGFDATGRYISPRTAKRLEAIEAWNGALTARGWPLIDASQRLLSRGHYPSVAQEKVLLLAGIGQPLWNGLTVTGVIEARGRALCDFTPPDFQTLIVEDVSEMAIGHLGKGLLYAHGLDEGGDPANGIGAHDAMWFAVRDMIFGKDRYPMPEIPASISRPVAGAELPDLPMAFEGLIKLLMDVLMIEIRAEDFFSFCQAVMRDPDLFKDRRAAAELGATLVERIRTDEAVHVGYLQTVISEMRSLTWKTAKGNIRGDSLLDSLWAKMVEWHAVERWEAARKLSEAAIRQLTEQLPNGAQIWAAFESADARAAA